MSDFFGGHLHRFWCNSDQKQRSIIINEQTCSLQLSDSVFLWAYLVWQTAHGTKAFTLSLKKKLMTLRLLMTETHMAINYITGRACDSCNFHGSSTIPIQEPIGEQ